MDLDMFSVQRRLSLSSYTARHMRRIAIRPTALTDDDAERAGKIIAGVLTLDQVHEEISAQYRHTE